MTSKIERQGVLNLVFLYAGTAIGLINTVLRTRVLTAEEIGVIGILLSLSSVAIFLITMGMPSGILKFYGRFRDDPARKTGFLCLCLLIVLALFGVVSAAFSVLQDFFVLQYDNVLIERYIDFVYFVFIFTAVNSVFNTILRAEHRSIHGNFIMKFTDRVLFLGFLTLMVFLPEIGFDQYFIFFLFTYLFRTALFVFFIFRHAGLRSPVVRGLGEGLIKELFTYNAFMFLSGLAGVLIATVDRLMVGYFINVSAAGVYTIVMTFPLLLRMIITGFASIAQPIIADCWNRGDTDSIRKIYRSNLNLQVLLGGAFFATFVAFGPEGLDFLGKEYAAAFWVMLFLAIGEMINVSTGLCGAIISFSEAFRFDFFLRVGLVVLAVVTNYLLIPLMGLEGAAIATASSLALYNVGKVLFVFFKFRMQPYGASTLATVAYSGVFGASLYGAQHFVRLENIAVVIGAAVVYFAVYLMFGALVMKLEPAVEIVKTIGNIVAPSKTK